MTGTGKLGVAVIGAGGVGRLRALTAARSSETTLRLVVDTQRARAMSLAAEFGADADADWRSAISREDIGAIVVCTPNALLVPIGVAALRSGRHVLVEKPMGRNATEGRTLAAEARRSGTVLKVGFNHRYRPALSRAHQLVNTGRIGRLLLLRARYGHGPQRGYSAGWRADAELAGGGELLDEGVQIIDLFHWFAGPAIRAQAELQSALWDQGRLEDNAYAILRFGGGVVGQFHVSMTEWQSTFCMDVIGEAGMLRVEGLDGAYGAEKLELIRRHDDGDPTTEPVALDSAESSWRVEWADFIGAIRGGTLLHGGPESALQILATVDALYAAARSGSAVAISPGAGAPLSAL